MSFLKKVSFLIFPIFFLLLSFSSCGSSKLTETPMEKFSGKWELQGRSMFEGIQIELISDKNSDDFKGKVIKTNENKYVKLFVDSGDTWVSSIRRTSNYQFELTEKKIGSELFSLYGQSTSTIYRVEFIDENTFGLSMNNANPTQSKIIYKKITN